MYTVYSDYLRASAFIPGRPGVPLWWLLADNVTRPVQIGKEKRQGRMALPQKLSRMERFMNYARFNFFRPAEAKPASPVPNRSMVAGSGTGAVPPPMTSLAQKGA
jgi:hypothetical protein